MLETFSSGDELKELYNYIPKLVKVKSSLAKILVFLSFTAVIGICAIIYTVHTIVNFSYVLIMEENVNKTLGSGSGFRRQVLIVKWRMVKSNKTTFTATKFQNSYFKWIQKCYSNYLKLHPKAKLNSYHNASS